MSRPVTTGKYIVPDNIQRLKPQSIPCLVKAISAPSKIYGSKIHYYVYDLSCGDGSADQKKGSGPCVGKIEGGVFCPNANWNKRYGNLAEAGQASDEHNASCIGQPASVDSGNASKEEESRIAEAAINMNLGLKDIDLQVKDYGEYAVVLASTNQVLDQLDRHFSTSDARMIYALGIIYFVQEYTPASYVGDVFRQSVLSNKWPSLAISENSVGEFLRLLGRHPVVCEEYSQELIENGSGLTAIDGHVILSCSQQNCLADYGNKYQKVGGKQLNILEAYDVENEIPLTSKAYEGGLLDKTSVQDLFEIYSFPSNTVFLVDMGFYSEDDLELYRGNGRHFIIPVPETTSISKAIDNTDPYSGSFVYQKTDENGVSRPDRILYRETTVRFLEDVYQKKLDAEAERKNLEEAADYAEGKKLKKYYARKVKHSAHGDDRIIICRDEDMHSKMIQEFYSQLGSDDFHSEEKLAELGPGFGVIVLRTNRKESSCSAKDAYYDYKRRWKLETHYNFLENIVRFCGLKTNDYYSMQGLSFLIQVVGQIKSAFKKMMRSSSSKYVSHLSVRECLVKAGHLKLSQHIDKKWHVSTTTKKITEIMEQLGADIKDDVEKLNASEY